MVYTANKSTQHVSIAAPKAQKPQTTEQFGYFLAGLIDADGHINKKAYVTITFAQKHVSVAYYIKRCIGYGSVKKIKHKKAYTYVVSNLAGITIIANLIGHKLRCVNKIAQFNSRMAPVAATAGALWTLQPNNSPVSPNNYWLAGFIQGDGSFQIKLITRASDPKSCNGSNKLSKQVGVVVQIDQKTDFLLNQIKKTFGGYVGCRKQKNGSHSYYYSSVSFSNAVKFINYLDRYQVMGGCLTCYWLWRKAYLQVQSKAHRTCQGLKQIEHFKKALTLLRQ